jgi:proline iminopeptidase
MWPRIEPYQTGYLKVSDMHEIYYELCGNSKGKPVFVLHGGPGGECTPSMRQYFDPKKFLVVLHDQRGCGKSKPRDEIRQNTTQSLVDDIEKLRTHLHLNRILLFGGSWGSTLALAYAETYPENVSGMVLRGVFTSTNDELQHYYHGGAGKFFPEAYNELLHAVPDSCIRPLSNYLFRLIKGGDSTARSKYSSAWLLYEFKIAELDASDKSLDRLRGLVPNLDTFAYTLGLMENYYMANSCFLEPNQLLRDADKIKEVPITLINGRYDMICPPLAAYRLHQRLPRSKLIIVEKAGHSAGEQPIEIALLTAVKEFED